MSQAMHAAGPLMQDCADVAHQANTGHARLGRHALGIALLLVANFVLRCTLEHSHLPPSAVFPGDTVPLSWRLLLPIDMGEAIDLDGYKASYHWFTTGMTVIKVLELGAKPHHVYYFLNAVLIVCTFCFSWWMFRSAVFSYTLSLCMGFGTQFYWLYLCSPVESFLLYVVYVEANLLCLHKLLHTGQRGWRIGYVATLVCVALCHEQWLDYLGFLTLASLFLVLYGRRTRLPALQARAVFVLLTSWSVATVYLAIRLSYGSQQYRLGHESEMIFTYQSSILAIEDVLSNVITLIYLAISNYFPPFMVSSNSLYYLGADHIMAEQHGYHAEKTSLVAMHHLFYWYFWAGIVFAIFVYFLVRNGKNALQQGSVRHARLFLGMLMIACGFAIHAVVKYRPYLSVPLLTYKCMTSNIGAAFLLAGCVAYARRYLPRQRLLYPALVALVWGVIGYGALARPHYLSHLSEQVGVGTLPDPCRHFRSSRQPGGTSAAPADPPSH